MRMALLFAIFFISTASGVFQVDQASRHNIGIAPDMLGIENACNLSINEISKGDVFEVADLRVVTVIPSVGNLTTDLAHPQALWSWSAKTPEHAKFVDAPSQECEKGNSLELWREGAPYLQDAMLTYRYYDLEKSVFLSGSGPNPVKIEIEPKGVTKENMGHLFSNLTIEIEGKIWAAYNYELKEYSLQCITVGEGDTAPPVCFCPEKYSSGTTTYEKRIRQKSVFQVETGPVEEFWVSPPLNSRLDGSQSASVLFFSRRMPSEILVLSDRERVGNISAYGFEIVNGSCGEQHVLSDFAPSGSQNFSMNMSDETIFPFQLVSENASYLPFGLEFLWNETAGKKEIELLYYDWFSNKFEYSKVFFVRNPARFSENVSIREADEKTTFAYLPQKPAPVATSMLGGLGSAIGIIAVIGLGFAALRLMRME